MPAGELVRQRSALSRPMTVQQTRVTAAALTRLFL